LHESTPLVGNNMLYIADRRKKEFTYPIHNHEVNELNFVEHAAGVRRIVGDSSEVIGDYDLVLITGSGLEHVWEQNECTSDSIREVTVQFELRPEHNEMLGTNPFHSIMRMMDAAQKGLCFSLDSIMKVYPLIDGLSSVQDGFLAVQQFFLLLYRMSLCTGVRTLATSSYAKVQESDDSRRITKVKDYIAKNYQDEIRLGDLASIAGMSPSSFSRFFKMHTSMNISDYIINIRLGYATRMLVDTLMTVAEISFDCGFNNLSNFNRIFKRKKGCSPSQFREMYYKKKIIV